MTEQEWLQATDQQSMLLFLWGTASDRKLRLFACACCRLIWTLLYDKQSREAVECSEQFADGRLDRKRLSGAQRSASAAWRKRAKSGEDEAQLKASYAAEAAKLVASATSRPSEFFGTRLQGARASLAAELLEQTSASARPASQRGRLLRDIFGNPFRSIALDPAWLSWHGGLLVSMAQKMYDSRDFRDMPVLADALEEAGCTNPDILSHCRQEGSVHVRGCFVLDLLLKQE